MRPVCLVTVASTYLPTKPMSSVSAALSLASCITLSVTVKFTVLNTVCVPVTVKSPLTVTLPVAVIVVNAPVDGVTVPIGVF